MKGSSEKNSLIFRRKILYHTNVNMATSRYTRSRGNRHERNNGTATEKRYFLCFAQRPLLGNGTVTASMWQQIQIQQ
jgi:hypothetical protein